MPTPHNQNWREDLPQVEDYPQPGERIVSTEHQQVYPQVQYSKPPSAADIWACRFGYITGFALLGSLITHHFMSIDMEKMKQKFQSERVSYSKMYAALRTENPEEADAKQEEDRICDDKLGLTNLCLTMHEANKKQTRKLAMGGEN